MSRYEEWIAQNFHDEPEPGSGKWHNWAVNQILDKAQEIERLTQERDGAINALHTALLLAGEQQQYERAEIERLKDTCRFVYNRLNETDGPVKGVVFHALRKALEANHE